MPTKPETQTGWQIYLRLLSYLKPLRGLFALSIACFFIYSCTQASFGYVIEKFIEALRLPGETNLMFVPILVVVIAAVRGASYFLANYAMAKISLEIVNKLRQQVFEKFLFLPSYFFDQRNSAELVSIITFNINQVNSSASNAVKTIFREGFTVIALLAYLVYKNWQLTTLFLLVAPMMAVIVSLASRRFRKLSRRIQSSMGSLAHVTNEAVSGYRLVRGYGGEDYESNRFRVASEKNKIQGLRFNLVHSLQTPVLQLILSVALAGVMWLVLNIEGTPESHVAYIVTAGLLARPIRALTQVNGQIQKGVAAAQSVFEVLDADSERDHGKLSTPRVVGDLEIRNLSFCYPEHDEWVLNNINLTIPAGQTVALVGKSGSGKTTLASLVGRFYEPSSGQILLDGAPLGDYQLDNLRSQMALVSQNITLFNCSVADNIAYGQLAGASIEDIRSAAESANALDFIEQLPDGFDTVIGEDGTRLSGGQRQRLAIARALLKNAPVLILDEATSALDTQSERAIQAALAELMRDRTTIVIAHRLSTIENADTIVVMGNGEILEQGTHQELITLGGSYAHLHANQAGPDAGHQEGPSR
jgi:subfamily B ATP-binding cassette protein MsbA